MQRCLEDGRGTDKDVDWLITKADSLHYLFNNVVNNFDINESAFQLVDTLRTHLDSFQDCVNSRSSTYGTLLCDNVPKEGGFGRPKVNIGKEQLNYLLSLSFPATEIARLFGVSGRTIYRRMSEFGLSVSAQYSDIDDAGLDEIVRDVLKDFPRTGYRRMIGFLKERGLRIQEKRVVECLRRVDYEGVIQRSIELTLINRRKYSVKGSNSLWHIDGNHKLIRWNFVIHGGIDGYSRYTTLQSFLCRCNADDSVHIVCPDFLKNCKKL